MSLKPLVGPRTVTAMRSGWKNWLARALKLVAGDGVNGGEDFVERREAAEVEFLAGEIGHAGAGGLEGKHERALEVIFRAEEFFLRDGRFLHGAKFGDGHVHDLADGFFRGARVDAEDSGVGIGSKFAEDGVSEALLFANILEEARGHSAAEKIVEDRGGEAAFIGEGDGRNADADVDLLEVALGFENDGRSGGGNRIVGIVEGRRKIAEFLFDEVENFLVRDVAGGGDEKMVRSEPVLETGAQGIAFETANGFGRAKDWTAEGMVGPEAAGEDVMEQVFGIVHVHLDFFEDNLALFFDVVGIEFGTEDEIGKDIEGDGEMRVEDLGVEADLFLGGEGVEHATDGIHFAGDVFGGAAFGALEDHVLEEMGDAVFGEGFAAGAVANPDANGDGADVLHGLGNDDKAVG